MIRIKEEEKEKDFDFKLASFEKELSMNQVLATSRWEERNQGMRKRQ